MSERDSDDLANSCCAPAAVGLSDPANDLAPDSTDAPEPPTVPTPRASRTRGGRLGMTLLPGGAFLMGSEDLDANVADGEGPIREVAVRPFWIDIGAVSNAMFAEFVFATGYVTDAERFGWSFVFAGLLPDDFPETRGAVAAPWWRQVQGATWNAPEGPESSIDERMNHPVVHVSWNDAMAYCRWAGTRLLTETEWEYAARGDLARKRYPWGDELTPGGIHRANVWQGVFPGMNALEDGYYGTAPVNAYPPNGFGLYNMSGNTWEWCADWFHRSHHLSAPRDNPPGPRHGRARVIRGGSYLCHGSYCNRYRVAARSSSTPESSTGHMGFRCARDA